MRSLAMGGPPVTSLHPDRQKLAEFAAGRLDESEVRTVEDHLAGCDTCVEVIDGLHSADKRPPDDPLQARLHGQRADAALLESPVREWIERVKDHLPADDLLSSATSREQATDLAWSELLKILGPPLAPGELGTLGRYRILQELGVGGMGWVFQAMHPVMERVVALKVIAPRLVNSPTAVARFRREVKAAAQLHHPNIAEAYDADSVGNLHFLVMEFVSGTDLSRLIREQGRVSVGHAAYLARQAAQGLDAAHRVGMVHRDIKPSNMLITLDGRLKLVDFGLARIATDSHSGQETSEHAVLGTPDYMAPEQAGDAHTVDIRADIYSLGCTLYQMLSGRVPFHGGSLVQKLKRHESEPPEPLAQLRSDVPLALVAVIERMMAKDPADRYVTPAEVVEALTPFALAVDVPAPLQTASVQALAEQASGAGLPVAAPRRIGRFEVLQVLGQGAFGRVYRARDPKLDRYVALKVPVLGAIGSEQELARFVREAQAAANLHHPNICPVYEVGKDGDQDYIVMAYVPGKSLAEHIKDRTEPLPAKQVALLVRKLALALDVAHKKGIIHRDLKPANIMFDSERKQAVIMDFGLARRQTKEAVDVTRRGQIMGTPAYMSPEQARGDQAAIGPASDVYGLGVMLYELLTLHRPFSGSMAEVLGKILHLAPEPPSKINPEVDRRLESICLKAMAKCPAERFGSMRHLADALNEFLKASAVGQVSSLPDDPKATSGNACATKPASEQGHLTELMAVLAEERKAEAAQRRVETEAAVEAAVRKARIPLWQWLTGGGFFATALLVGIFFFMRTPTATVIINIDVDLSDVTLSFFLDGNPIRAEELANPVELKVGKHELLVKRGDTVIKRMHFIVRGGKNPSIEYKEITTSPPPADPDRSAAEWVLQQKGLLDLKVNGRDQRVPALAELPDGAFQVVVIKLPAGADPAIDKGLGQLQGLTNLDTLQLGHTQVTDAGLESLQGMKKLRVLWLQETPVTGSGFAHIRDLRQLEHLELGGTAVDDAGLAHLKNLSKLNSLALNATPVTDRGLEWLKGLTNMEVLQLGHTQVTDAGLQSLQGMKKLRVLWLQKTLVTGSGLAHIKDLRQLQHLELGGTAVDDAGLEHLKNLSKLNGLALNATPVTDRGLRSLKGLTIMDNLQLSHTQVTDEGLEHLQGMTKLRVLWLHNTAVTDAGLEHLKALQNLEAITLDSTQVSDAGLIHLKGLSKLNGLNLSGTRVSDAGIADLKAALPNCQINR
jgi:serine/threonine protein kinase/Leucine-rich repeat (LRR) protein